MEILCNCTIFPKYCPPVVAFSYFVVGIFLRPPPHRAFIDRQQRGNMCSAFGHFPGLRFKELLSQPLFVYRRKLHPMCPI